MSVTLASEIQFKKLCDVLEAIVKARASKKFEVLQKFIQQCRDKANKIKEEHPDADVSLFPILRLLLPQLERERGPSNLKEKTLANLYVRVFCLGKTSREARKLIDFKAPASGKFIGSDFASRAYWVLRNRLPDVETPFTIERINLFLDDISKRTDTVHKDEIFKILIQQTNAIQLKWITRIILKDLRLGIGTKKILHAYHSDANELFEVKSDLRQVCEKLHDPKVKLQHGVEVFYHFKPMLLERLSIEETGKLFNNNEIYFVQNKYDGERSQIHMKDGTFKYFTRQGYDITGNVGYGQTAFSGGFLSGKFAKLLNPKCRSIILDGELMGWHKQKKKFGSKGMDYDVKKLSPNSSHQPCFVAFDILMYNDVLLMGKPYEDRIKVLKEAFTEEEGCLIRCDLRTVSNSDELLDAFNKSLTDEEEGIVLKKTDTVYRPNVRNGSGCYKIKAEYSDNLVQDLDLIILGGYYGEGKFTGLIQSFLVGVCDLPSSPGENPTKFYAVVSVSNGISIEKLKELRTRFENHWSQQCPPGVFGPKSESPDLWIHPKNSLILTVRATEIIKTASYPIGYCMRFPRVIKIRDDKPWFNVCTTVEFLSLVKDTNIVQKLTKRQATSHDIEKAPDVKTRRVFGTNLAKLGEKCVGMKVHDGKIVPITRLLDGREFCVINGNEEFSKAEIERILLQHRAKVVQNPRKETFCVIVGNVKTKRAKNVMQSMKYDVVTLDWFKRVTDEKNWSELKDFLPWDLICCRDSTKRRLAENYDEYYDSYTIDADEESLKRSLEKAEEAIETTDFTLAEENEMDQELFEDGVSPFSLFRNVVGYFDGQLDCAKLEFRFMAGRMKENIDDDVTHVFVKNNTVGPAVQDLCNAKRGLAKIVDERWIEDCFRDRKLLPLNEYLVK